MLPEQYQVMFRDTQMDAINSLRINHKVDIFIFQKNRNQPFRVSNRTIIQNCLIDFVDFFRNSFKVLIH